MKAAAKQAKSSRVLSVADVSGKLFKRLQAHLLRIGGKATRAFQLYCITRQLDVHRFICVQLESLTLEVSGHKYAPSLEEIKV